MKRLLIVVVAAALPAALTLAQQPAKPKAKPVLKTTEQKASYGIGLNIGRQIAQSFKQDGVALNVELFTRGIADALTDAEPALSNEEIREALIAYQELVRKNQQAIAEENKKAGQQFLEANKKKKNVKTTKSGLQYEILKKGTGRSPTAKDTVKTHYEGRLLDGTVFDSSYKRDQPATFRVSGVIKGWTEALQMMKVGGKWRLFIPAELAYGARPPRGSAIGPNSVLIFEVELLEIVE